MPLGLIGFVSGAVLFYGLAWLQNPWVLLVPLGAFFLLLYGAINAHVRPSESAPWRAMLFGDVENAGLIMSLAAGILYGVFLPIILVSGVKG